MVQEAETRTLASAVGPAHTSSWADNNSQLMIVTSQPGSAAPSRSASAPGCPC